MANWGLPDLSRGARTELKPLRAGEGGRITQQCATPPGKAPNGGGRPVSAPQLQDGFNPYAPFEIAFGVAGTPELVVLRSAPDADRATQAFYDDWERLKADQVTGHVLLIYHHEVARTLLRELLW
jgi:hypothetical protein